MTIDYNNIRWHFAREHASGVFADGRPWVVAVDGKVTVTRIELLGPERDAGSVPEQDGSMIDPLPGGSKDFQGFDSRAYGYNASKALYPPFDVLPGQCCWSAESRTDEYKGGETVIDGMAIFHAVDAEPEPDTFAPHPYAGEKQAFRWSDVDLIKLGHHERVGNEPDMQAVIDSMKYPWGELCASWAGKTIFARRNMPDYGREISWAGTTAIALLLLDVGDREQLLRHVIQRGIDYYGYVQAGGQWHPDGGHAHGRKPLIVVAGHFLNFAPMRDIGYTFRNGEDSQSFYITQEDKERGHGYENFAIGTPEWGIRHETHPEQDNPARDARYRSQVVSTISSAAAVITAFGLREAWGHDAFFDMIERMRSEMGFGASGGAFLGNVFKRYWGADKPSIPPMEIPEPEEPMNDELRAKVSELKARLQAELKQQETRIEAMKQAITGLDALLTEEK